MYYYGTRNGNSRVVINQIIVMNYLCKYIIRLPWNDIEIQNIY